MPTSNEPYSEQYRIAAEEWADLDAAARMLEEGKTTYLAQRIAQHGDMPHNKAEREVKASSEWADYIKKMVNAKTRANKARIKLDYLKMRYWEEQGSNATRRAEMRM